MAFCRNCGAELADTQLYCGNCGAPVEVIPEVEKTEPTVVEQPQNRGIEVKTLVLAIVNFVFFVQALGVVSFIFTLLAANRPDPDAENKLKVARTCNKIGLIAGIAIWAMVILLYVFLILFYVFIFVLVGLGSM